MSIRIGICSESLELIRQIKNKVMEKACCKEETLNFHCFSSMEKLMVNSLNTSYDILFADLDTSGFDNMRALSEFVIENPIVSLILITNQSGLIFEAIKLRPFRFVRKQNFEFELNEAVDEAFRKIIAETIIYVLKKKSTLIRVRLSEVYYVESRGHYLNFHSDGKDVLIRGKISEYECKLSVYGFIRVHRGFLVNVRLICNVSSRQITMVNGETLPISRNNIEMVRSSYERCAGKFVHIFS